jgi:hypothetical protein
VVSGGKRTSKFNLPHAIDFRALCGDSSVDFAPVTPYGFGWEENLLHRNEEQFRGGLVFKAHSWLYHSTLGSRVIKKKQRRREPG